MGTQTGRGQGRGRKEREAEIQGVTHSDGDRRTERRKQTHR